MTTRTVQARVIRSDAQTIERLRKYRDDAVKQMILLPREGTGWMMMRKASFNMIINILLDNATGNSTKKGSK